MSERGVAARSRPRRTGGEAGAYCVLGDPSFAERYRAIDARDTRFDGQFFTAVSSTGVYCRPSCPARTPKMRNVTFFLTSAAAHEAGYRACKRCLPEAAPGTPEWDLRRDLAGRAMRLIADGVVDREGVESLAARLGYSGRQVHRLLSAELGAGPLALARARRAQTARSLLVGTNLRLADVAFAAGFGSVRQFNATVLAVFDARPGELRSRGRGRAAGEVPGGRVDVPAVDGAPVRLDLALPVRGPFDAPGLFRFLAARAVGGVEAAGSTAGGGLRYARTLALPHGPGAVEVVATETPASGWRVRAELELSSLADVATAVARVRRMLDLNADPIAVDTALSADPTLAPLVAATPGVRLPGAVDPHELVIRAIVGQQISVAAARTHLTRLAAVLGRPYSSSFAGLDRLFPSPADIAGGVSEPVAGEPLNPERPLRLPARSVRTVVATARALADGTLAVDVGADPEALRVRLAGEPGIGPWTASYITMRVLADPDSWLHTDVALVAGARALGLLDRDLPSRSAHRALADHAVGWAPWRSYAVLRLWQRAAA
ncbi:AraC family transcriptional regulator of adaptative response / DNA-3-methyladenine glycosylase II [Actinoalloteichus hoggarensis]|uniref:DNA-3-methyladenine glycosylase 2 n=1 Tax=Actinoalloteichus hoggarensis TaxID=1470176 RepID=A0A221W009_9PSEU|nr:AlkA N-terminal domain-containing protein [Actinoalloteichus hoggarensis]ASO19102.1 DNA-3-methyladenine glycosylase 2 [Actinoalloteichus hoggarensis]MBB5920339.1 AraC family transcriptional regulator of adaptative response / DNA-3-methyladenine glycosylase II [Actinoalloteichus hoggarensis]